MRSVLFFAVSIVLLPAVCAVAGANTSHEGWPRINGDLKMHKADQSGPLHATKKRRHNELLGGHGNDVIRAGRVGDVLWGDYKPSGQPTTQVDRIYGGPGKDFIYASHGTNLIYARGGADQIHVHFGRGEVWSRTPESASLADIGCERSALFGLQQRDVFGGCRGDDGLNIDAQSHQ